MAAPPPPPPPPPPPLPDDLDDELPPVETAPPPSSAEGVSEGCHDDSGKVWERPWSLEEIREGAKNWTLASDAGLLLYLKEFSKRLSARTREIDGQFNGLAQETKGTDVRMNNVFNDFMMLSNVQFVENRVYEENEEDKAEEEGSPVGEKRSAEVEEDKKAVMMGRVREALSRGFQVLENEFELVQEEVMSPVEDEGEEGGELVATIRPEPVLQVRDPYAERFFPSIIGTQDFYHSERLGLVEYISEEEDYSDSDDDDSNSEGRGGGDDLFDSTASSGLSSSSSGGEEEQQAGSCSEGSRPGSAPPPQGGRGQKEKEKTKTKRKKKRSEGSGSGGLFDSTESSSDDDGLFQSASEGESPDRGNRAEGQPLDIAAELNKKFGKPSGQEAGDEEVEQRRERSKSHSKKKKKKGEKKDGKSDALFAGDGSDEGSSDGGGGGGGGGLFDEKPGGLFDGSPTPPPTPPPQTGRGGGAGGEPRDPFAEKRGGGGGLFGDSEDDSDGEYSAPTRNPSKPPVGSRPEAGALFGDDDDDDFMSASDRTETAPQPQKQKQKQPTTLSSALFDDDENDDLFEAGSTPEPSQPKKKPVGGVSMFGGDDLFAAVKKRSEASESSDAAPPPTRPPPDPFADSDDDGLFEGPAGRKPQAPPTQAQHSPASRQRKDPPPSADLFGDEGDDEGLFVKQDPPPAQSPAKKKKPVGGVSMFGGVDAPTPQLPTSSHPEETTGGGGGGDSDEDLFAAASKKKPVVQPALRRPANKKADALFGLSDDDDDALFTASLAKKPAQGPAAKVLQPPRSSPKASPQSRSKYQPRQPSGRQGPAREGEGEEDEDLFASKPTPASGKPPPVGRQSSTAATTRDELFPSPSPPPSGEDDLFSSPSRGPEQKQQKQQQPQVRPKPAAPAPAPAKAVQSRKGPFDDDDDLFSSKPAPSPGQARKKKGSPSSFDDLFGEKEEGGRSPGQPAQRGRTAAGPKPTPKPAKMESVTADPLGFITETQDKPKPPQETAQPSPTAGKEPGKTAGKEGPKVSSKPAKPSQADLKTEQGRHDDQPTTKSPPAVAKKAPKKRPEAKVPGKEERGPAKGREGPSVKSKPSKQASSTTAEAEEDLFATSPPVKSPVSPPGTAKPQKPLQSQLSDDLDDLFEETAASPRRRKPVGGVSLFGGVDLLGGRERKAAGEEDELLGSASHATLESPARTKVLQSPAASPKTSSKKTKTPTSIDPTRLLPGAGHRSPATGDKGVSFEEPISTAPLESLTKNRAPLQKRRPPSRVRGRGPTSPSAVSTPPTASSSGLLDDDIFATSPPLADAPSSLTQSISQEADIFADLEGSAKFPTAKSPEVKSPSLKTKSLSVPDNKTAAKKGGGVPFDDTDAKASPGPSRAGAGKKKKKGLKQGNEALLFGNTGDIFSDLPPVASATGQKKVAKKKGGAKKTGPARKGAPEEPPSPVPTTESNKDEELPFGDVAAASSGPAKKTTKKKVVKKKAVPQAAASKDFDIFNTNTASIFDNV